MEKFSELLSEAMENTLRGVFGKKVVETIYGVIENNVVSKRDKLSDSFGFFYSYLEKLLGSEGARIIQVASIRQLYLTVQKEYQEVETYLAFLDELYETKFQLLNQPLTLDKSTCN